MAIADSRHLAREAEEQPAQRRDEALGAGRRGGWRGEGKVEERGEREEAWVCARGKCLHTCTGVYSRLPRVRREERVLWKGAQQVLLDLAPRA